MTNKQTVTNMCIITHVLQLKLQLVELKSLFAVHANDKFNYTSKMIISAVCYV